MVFKVARFSRRVLSYSTMALSDADVATVQSTVPILETGGEQLIKYFYARMMRENPEVRKFFNQTNQKTGAQPKALAHAVLDYAKNIRALEKMGPEVGVIIQRHVALDIHAKHYPIVGTNLIHSMAEVLGPDVATPQVLDAWTRAYQQLANILIGAEQKVYDQIGERDIGGWDGFRSFVIEKKTPLNKQVASFDLVPADGKPVLKTVPGQYITLRVVDNGVEQRRSYSVSGTPSNKGYRITVKSIGFVSGNLHKLNDGDKIDLRPPLGSLVWDPKTADSTKPVVLIAGGIGVTPLAAMALSGAPARMLYYAHSDGDRVLASEIKPLKNIEWVDVKNRPTAEDLKANVPNNASVYCVGPSGFMDAVYEMLKKQGFPTENYHQEVFGPTTHFNT